MAISSPIQTLSGFLENYRSRSQVFRTLQFASCMLSGLAERSFPQTAVKLLTVSSSISDMRVMLRLMDDLPMLAYTLKNWKTKKGQSIAMTTIQILDTISSHLYYPTEHIAWAADRKLISIESRKFWMFGVFLWMVSLTVSFLQSVATIVKINRELASGIESGQKKHVTFEDQKSGCGVRERTLHRQRFYATLSLLQSLSDLMNAINWMPEGFLWSGKLSNFWVGLFGMMSSLIGLYKILPSRNISV